MLVKSRVKYIQSLGQKKFRDESGLFIAEGPKMVEDLLHTIPGQIEQICALNEWIDAHQSLLGQTKVDEITPIELEKISQLSTPNQVLAVVRQFKHQPIISSKGKITLALDDIRDPGNLGTILRIADWFGVSNIVCSVQSADIYNPKVVQSSMGSIARVQVSYAELFEWLKLQQDTKIYASVLGGKNIGDMKKIDEGIILIGNESRGIHPSLSAFGEHITIPRKGGAESLNAAVAAGIILSHLC